MVDHSNGNTFTLRGPAWTLVGLLAGMVGGGGVNLARAFLDAPPNAAAQHQDDQQDAQIAEINKRLAVIEANLSTNTATLRDLTTEGNTRTVMSSTTRIRFEEIERRLERIEQAVHIRGS